MVPMNPGSGVIVTRRPLARRSRRRTPWWPTRATARRGVSSGSMSSASTSNTVGAPGPNTVRMSGRRDRGNVRLRDDDHGELAGGHPALGIGHLVPDRRHTGGRGGGVGDRVPRLVAVPNVGAVDDTTVSALVGPSGSESLMVTSNEPMAPTSTVSLSSAAIGGSLVNSGARTETMIDALARRFWELVTSYVQRNAPT